MSFLETAIFGGVVLGLGALTIGTAARAVGAAGRAVGRAIENSHRNSRNEEQYRRAEQRTQQLEEQVRRSENQRYQTQQNFERSMQQNQRRMQEAERQNQQMSASIRNLNEEVRRQEQRHNQRIQQIQRQHEQDIKQQNERITQEVGRLQAGITSVRSDMEQLREQTQTQFEEMQAQRQRDLLWTKEEIQNVNQQISNLEQQISQEKEQQRELADYWIQQAQRLAADIRENYRPEKFEPQTWASVQQTLANALTDINTGVLQSAVSNGRAAFQEASALRDTLAEQELEWQRSLEAAQQMEAALLQSVAEAEVRIYTTELDGETIEEDRGVDYWSYGQLSVLENRIDEARIRLNADTQNLTTEQLTALEQELHSLLSELALLENAAATNFVMANERYQMALRVGEVLGNEFMMDEQDGDYFASENRDEYHASFTNPVSGEQAVVVITPLLGDDGVVVNHAEVIVRTPSNDPGRRQEVNQALVENISREVPGFKLPCSEQYHERTNEEAERLGNISAVSEGMQNTRSQCSVTGVTYDQRSVVNPACAAKPTTAPAPTVKH